MFQWDHGIVTFTEVDDSGYLGIQIDVPGEKQGGVASGEMGTPYGLFARPHDPELDGEGEPDPAKGCGALYAFYGSRLHVWPQTDPRLMAKLPRVKKGGSVFFGGKKEQPSFIHVDGDTGSLDGYFPYAFSGDVPAKAMALAFDTRTAGAESIGFVHGEGMSFSMVAGGKNSGTWKNKSGNAYFEVNDDGAIINANTNITGAVNMGNPTAAIPVALATPLLAYLVSLEALLASIAVTVPTTSPAITAFINAQVATKLLISATLVKGF